MPMTRIMAYCFDHMIWFHWMTCKLDTMSSRDQSIAIGFLIRRDSKFSTNLVICQSVKQMLKLRLTLKYEAKMHKLTSNLYILASTFSVSFNFSITYLYAFANHHLLSSIHHLSFTISNIFQLHILIQKRSLWRRSSICRWPGRLQVQNVTKI